MKGTDFFPSKYLKAEEIADKMPLIVTISRVDSETLSSHDKGEETKPVVHFLELDKGVILNKTNWYAIAAIHGDDSDLWTGKQIALVVVDVDAFGDVVSAIRVKKISPKAQRIAPQESASGIQVLIRGEKRALETLSDEELEAVIAKSKNSETIAAATLQLARLRELDNQTEAIV